MVQGLLGCRITVRHCNVFQVPSKATYLSNPIECLMFMNCTLILLIIRCITVILQLLRICLNLQPFQKVTTL